MRNLYHNNRKGIWITWERQIRNRSMADKLGIELHQFIYTGKRFARYYNGSIRTLSLINRLRPRVVFSQNPSVILNLLLMFTKNIYSFKHVIDAHYAGVVAINGSRIFQMLLDFINKRADLVIVTNTKHFEYLQSIGSIGFVCEDPLPEIKNNFDKFVDMKYVLLICSFDIDEPFEEVFKISKYLKEKGLPLIVTGNYSKRNIDPLEYPFVTFLGYIPYEEYCGYLFGAAVVVDLTNVENCLLCGAYEAMVAEIPLVTSDTKSLRDYFIAGTIFTKNDAESILESILLAYRERRRLIFDIKAWKTIAMKNIDSKISLIRKELNI